MQPDAAAVQASGGVTVAAAENLLTAKCEVEVGKTTVSEQPGGAVRRDTRIVLRRGLFAYILRFAQITEPEGRRHRCQWHFGAGLGMQGPSLRNWYDAGFIDLLLNGHSLDAAQPQIAVKPRTDGQSLWLRWPTPDGQVSMEIFVRADGGLQINGGVVGEIEAARLRLWCIPGAGWGEWRDMDKAIATASGTFPHGTPVPLKPHERWIVYLDRTYDVPHEHAEGPSAVVFLDPPPTKVTCDNGRYVVTTTADLDPANPRFSIVLYDFHGLTNAQALEVFRGRILPAFAEK